MAKSSLSRQAAALLLCIACLMSFTGCRKETAETVPVETEVTAQTEAPVITVQDNLSLAAAETEAAEQTETAETTAQDDTVLAEAETEAAEQTESTQAAEIQLQTDSETVADETAADETEPVISVTESEEEMIAKSQYTELENQYFQLESQQKQSKKLLILAVVVAVLLLVVAIVERIFWGKREKALKKKLSSGKRATAVTGIHIGKVHGIGNRSSQQDCFAVSNPEDYRNKGVLAVLADGMGGMENGEKASQTAVMATMNRFLNAGSSGKETMISMLAAAKSDMETINQNDPQSTGGTTLLTALVFDSVMDFTSVGDSRICLYRDGVLMNINREHTYQQELFRAVVNGQCSYQQAVTDDRRGCITCYMGMGDLPMVDFPSDTVRLLAGDKVILMSDGVYNALSQRELCLALQYPAADAAEAIESFIRSKNFPDQDNYTAVILECT